MELPYIVEKLIFASLKPTFLCFGFGTFHFLIQTLFLFHFDFFDLNDETFVNFLQGWLARNLAKVTKVAPEDFDNWKTLKIYMAFITKDEIDDFSSKQSFEEKSRSYIITMKFFEMKTYFEPPPGLLALLDTLKTKFAKP